ncbi:MAG: flagellar basal body-associated FliL family protein [Deltaproteobacteria bacterium]|nr:flagellar basal body-associated FliL family protein [Deltaproteobacteria bacterium]MBW1918598.1 flagellar basal body-associated FliL family protein [Deltaproteobacteria bacterium]MBW1934038.1 flagellar basal body-associated FliL family protein [Deltaproteobacteria bacterium]MBW1976390.1 flagellar basal body-associated FliL family protein [Deltaproteobacteria bacterium]MBW2043332.1 flagellar basal body-associated FliL family protein [Deltaproteobacteria bacterium]
MPEKEDVKEKTQTKKSFPKLVIIAALVIILGAGGLFARGLLFKDKTKDSNQQAETPKGASQSVKEEPDIVLPLDPFIVNLMDKAQLGKRYLKIGISLQVPGEEQSKTVEVHKAELRDAILLLLSSRSFGEIRTVEGKIALKQALMSAIAQVVGPETVHNIYFTEFVVQ